MPQSIGHVPRREVLSTRYRKMVMYRLLQSAFARHCLARPRLLVIIYVEHRAQTSHHRCRRHVLRLSTPQFSTPTPSEDDCTSGCRARSEQTLGCEDHKCAYMYRREEERDDDGCARGHLFQATAHPRKPPARPACREFVMCVCVFGGEPLQLGCCKQNMNTSWWVGPGGTLVAGTCV